MSREQRNRNTPTYVSDSSKKLSRNVSNIIFCHVEFWKVMQRIDSPKIFWKLLFRNIFPEEFKENRMKFFF